MQLFKVKFNKETGILAECLTIDRNVHDYHIWSEIQ